MDPSEPETDLRVTSIRIGDPTELRAEGQIDLATVPYFQEEVERAAATAPEGSRIVIDLSGCAFIDSTGLRVLSELCVHGDDGGVVFVLGATSAPVRRVLEVSGLADVLPRDR